MTSRLIIAAGLAGLFLWVVGFLWAADDEPRRNK